MTIYLFSQRKVAESADLSSQLEQVRRDFAVAMNELQRLQTLLKNASQAIRTALQVHYNGATNHKQLCLHM